MWRYLVGLAAGVVLMAGGVLWWRTTAIAGHGLPNAPQAIAGAAAGDDAMPEPPMASEKTREQRRLSRIDHDKDGKVSRDEFLAARRRNFAKLDKDGDGKLSFDEYAAKAIERFNDADKEKTGLLTPAEFATTKAVRQTRTTRCPRPTKPKDEDDG
ncbi:EF-hand domain-containing protein [Sphingomonas sp. MMS24-J13]|uniref:EF-hand domain-containing protein n=1 Tax=Sphingomonas sp. MMS24-J13 TaxID=3238686 RepID=UPI00384AF61A